VAGEFAGVGNRARGEEWRAPSCSSSSSASICTSWGSRGGRNRRRRRGQWLPRLGLHLWGGKHAWIWAGSSAIASWHGGESKARSRASLRARELGGSSSMAARTSGFHGKSVQRMNGEPWMGEEEEELTLSTMEVTARSKKLCGRRIRRRQLAGPARSRGSWRRVGCSSSSSASICTSWGSRGGRNRRRRRGQWLPRLGLHRWGGKHTWIWAGSSASASWHGGESKARSRASL